MVATEERQIVYDPELKPEWVEFHKKQQKRCVYCNQKRMDHKVAGGGHFSFSEILVCPTSVFKESYEQS